MGAHKLLYNTTEACEALGVCYDTLLKYTKLLQILPRKHRQPRQWGSWKTNYYSYGDLCKMIDILYPPKDRYRLSMQQRVELELAKNCTKSDKI